MAGYSAFSGSKNLSGNDIESIIKTASKRRLICLIVSLIFFGIAFLISELSIPYWLRLSSYIIPGVFSGYGIFSHNVIVYIKSNSERKFSLIVTVLWGVIGLIILPAIIIFILNKVFPYKSFKIFYD